jgi:hypothetical protein
LRAGQRYFRIYPEVIRKRVEVCILAVAIFAAVAALYGFGAKADRRDGISFGQSDGCVTCHRKQSDGAVALYSTSVHFGAGKSCNNCHGGDPSAQDKQAAHSLNFVGQPDTEQSVKMCGSCHRPELALYKASHHFPEHKNVTRVDCVQCHGAHSVGSPKRDFSFGYFCSGCHGQEYLPGLQQQFQDMLTLWDDMEDSVRAIEANGHHPSEAVMQKRKEIQSLTADIVHRTDLEAGTGKIPHILELGEQLKQAINKEKGSK